MGDARCDVLEGGEGEGGKVVRGELARPGVKYLQKLVGGV